jgi:hypothetical protein
VAIDVAIRTPRLIQRYVIQEQVAGIGVNPFIWISMRMPLAQRKADQNATTL